MSSVGLFAMGVVVTLIVCAALGLLVYGAILDGRYAAEHSADEAPQQPPASSPATGRQPECQPERNRADMPHNIVETAREAGTFQTLLTAVDAAGLGDTLADGGPFTVFAPTDEAFVALSPEAVQRLIADPSALVRVLTYHVVPGRITTAQITHDSEQKTVEGGVLKLAVNGGVTVNDATVIQADVEAENGVIHVIDQVLIPAA
jgi:uncharacterized surface protein with fasciclin (FAS1) repeats